MTPYVPTSTVSSPGHARRAAGLALLVTCLALSGCGVPVVGKMGHLLGGERASAEEQMAEARARSVLEPSQPYWPWRMGELYAAADSLSQAEAALKASLERDRLYAPSLSLLSKIYYDAGRYAEAISMLESAREAAGAAFDAELVAGLALHYDALDRPDRSRALMTRVPHGHVQQSGSAAVFLALRSETPEKAAQPAANALSANGKSAVNQNNFGITTLRSGDPEAAKRAFLEAIDLDPDLPGPYYNLAIVEKYYLFDDDAAAKWFRRYQKRSNADPDGLVEAFRRDAGQELAQRKDDP